MYFTALQKPMYNFRGEDRKIEQKISRYCFMYVFITAHTAIHFISEKSRFG